MKINLTIALTKKEVETILESQGKMAKETTYDVCKTFIKNAVRDSINDMDVVIGPANTNHDG